MAIYYRQTAGTPTPPWTPSPVPATPTPRPPSKPAAKPVATPPAKVVYRPTRQKPTTPTTRAQVIARSTARTAAAQAQQGNGNTGQPVRMYKDAAEAGLPPGGVPGVPDWYWNPYLDPFLDADTVSTYWNAPNAASNAKARTINQTNPRGYYSGRSYYGGSGYSSRSYAQANRIDNWYSTLINWVIP